MTSISNVHTGEPAGGVAATYGTLARAKYRALLDALNKAQELLEGMKGIDTPSIVVVGHQSTGKTTVLEAISDVSLPRGSVRSA